MLMMRCNLSALGNLGGPGLELGAGGIVRLVGYFENSNGGN